MEIGEVAGDLRDDICAAGFYVAFDVKALVVGGECAHSVGDAEGALLGGVYIISVNADKFCAGAAKTAGALVRVFKGDGDVLENV